MNRYRKDCFLRLIEMGCEHNAKYQANINQIKEASPHYIYYHQCRSRSVDILTTYSSYSMTVHHSFQATTSKFLF